MDLDAIQLVQNKLARPSNNKRLSDKVSTKILLQNINIDSINQTHAQIKLTEIWKSFKDENSNILKITKVKSYEQGSRTRSGTALNLVELKTIAMSSKTFKNDAIRIWNQAPDSRKTCESLYTAKKAIKSFIKTLPI